MASKRKTGRSCRKNKILAWSKKLLLILFVAFGLIITFTWFKPYEYCYGMEKLVICSSADSVQSKLISLKENSSINRTNVDTAAIYQKFLCDLRENGQLITSDEFASRITDYYNALIAVLATLLGVLTIGQWFAVSKTFENRFDEKSKEMDENLKNDIEKTLKEMLKDSIEMRDVMVEALANNLVEKLATHEEVECLREDLGKICDKYEKIVKIIGDIHENTSKKLSVCVESPNIETITTDSNLPNKSQ